MRTDLVATIANRNLAKVQGKDEKWHDEMLRMDMRMCNLTDDEAAAVFAWVQRGIALDIAPVLPDHTNELPAQKALAAHIAACNDGQDWDATVVFTAANYPIVRAIHRASGKALRIRTAEAFADCVERWAYSIPGTN